MLIWCIFLNVVATTYFQSIGRPLTAIVLSMLRQGLCLLPVIWFLPYFFEDKPLAIWLSMPISDLVCNALTLIPLMAHMRFLRLASERSLRRSKSSE
jgi:Na+-driven multidrug efflux pump